MTSKSSIGKEISKCKICGDIVKLSTEHIPPRAALNNKPIKLLKPDESIKLLTRNKLPWDQNDLGYKIIQKWMTLESLCIKCNNFTGRKYGNSYKDLVLSISDIFWWRKLNQKIILKLNMKDLNT